MSRLYPQWIDVAKLIEPLHLHQQQVQQEELQRLQFASTNDTTTKLANEHPVMSQQQQRSTDNITLNGHCCTASVQPTTTTTTTSPMTDGFHFHDATTNSKLADNFSINNNNNNNINNNNSNIIDNQSRMCPVPMAESFVQQQQQEPMVGAGGRCHARLSMSEFALSERHSECLRIVRQLLDAMNKSNLILLRSFVCVLWHIANNSEYNKMSANNLGVCVGQSLLNDEHQSSVSSSSSLISASGCNGAIGIGAKSMSSSTFSKRHRRTRSQCLLSSTLSLSSSSSSSTAGTTTSSSASSSAFQPNGCYLNSNTAQVSSTFSPCLTSFFLFSFFLSFSITTTKTTLIYACMLPLIRNNSSLPNNIKHFA